MKSKIQTTIPRAIYYLSPKIALKSLLHVLFKKFRFERTEQFEEAFSHFIGSKNTLATSHARIAFYIILKSLKLQEKDEVLMSGVNLPDMINMVLLNKLIPRLFDYQVKSFNFDLENVKSKITPRTKVLFITVLAGIESNVLELINLGRNYNLTIVIDQTQSMGMTIGVERIKLAKLSDFSIYSLCDLKDIHTHRGGVIAFNNIDFYDGLKKIRDEVSTLPTYSYFFKFILEDLFSSIILRRKFFHYFVSTFLKILQHFNKSEVLESLTKGSGIKFGNINLGRGLWGGDGDLIRSKIPFEMCYRFTDMQVNLGMNQLKKVDKIQNKRVENAYFVMAGLKNSGILNGTGLGSNFWKFPIWCDRPKLVQSQLLKRNIDSAPTNLPSLSTLENFKNILIDKTPNSDLLVKSVLYVPIHYYINKDELLVIINDLNEVCF